VDKVEVLMKSLGDIRRNSYLVFSKVINLKSIFNGDETGLFYSLLHSRTLNMKFLPIVCCSLMALGNYSHWPQEDMEK
jgi:hypothetical protein